jgi:hypothetical protein
MTDRTTPLGAGDRQSRSPEPKTVERGCSLAGPRGDAPRDRERDSARDSRCSYVKGTSAFPVSLEGGRLRWRSAASSACCDASTGSGCPERGPMSDSSWLVRCIRPRESSISSRVSSGVRGGSEDENVTFSIGSPSTVTRVRVPLRSSPGGAVSSPKRRVRTSASS